MMKLLAGFLFLAVAVNYASADNLQCSLPVPTLKPDWIKFGDECLVAMRDQIQKEIDASYLYLAMGAHFSRDTVNRPGFSEFFFKSAKEEREHGMKLIEYLSMRGKLTSDVTKLIKTPKVPKDTWTSGAAALEDALQRETEVTDSIRKLIHTCEKRYNHYHLVDYLTGVYLEEQLHGQRELAGKLITLKKMMTQHGDLGEFLFDKSNM